MPTPQSDALRLDHRRRIRDVLLHVDRHISQAVCVEDLARIACFSPFHFQRIFLAYTGETVGQYQQRKRLERAIRLLAEDKKSILEIALDVGYETPAALTKLFKRWTGATPTAFKGRSLSSKLDSYQPLTPPRPPKTPFLCPVLQDIPELFFVYIEVKGMEDGTFTKAAQPAFEEMYRWVTQNQIADEVLYWMGVFPHRPSHYQDATVPFWFGVAMAEPADIPIPFSGISLAPGKIAVFTHRGPYEYLLQTWNLAYQGWLPGSGHTLRDMYPFERYLTNPNKTPPEDAITEVCIPIHTD